MNRRVVLLVLLAAVAGANRVWAAADDPTLSAEAGLDGLAKPGRWAPVFVTIDTRADDISGELILEWGHARVRRTVTIAAPSRRQFELYIRTADVRDVMTIRLESQGRNLRTIETPVRLASIDETVTLCVAAPNDVLIENECSATMAPGALPRSWRGYDAADGVVSAPANGVAPADDQRRALELWQAIRLVEQAGHGVPAAGIVPAALQPADRTRVTLAWYLAAMPLIAVALRGARGRARLLCPALAVAVIGGSAATLATGRSAPIVVHHASVAQQFAGTGEALVAMRGVVAFPAFEHVSLHSTAADGVLTIRPTGGESAGERFDRDGFPLLDGSFGLGATKAFTLDAVAEFRALDESRTGSTTRISNVSSSNLRNCELPAGFPTRRIDTFAPGQTIETGETIVGDDPIVTCTWVGSPVEFLASDRTVVTDGTTIVVYHLSAPAVPDDPH